MKTLFLTWLAVLSLPASAAIQPSSGIKIELDYSYDTSGFFNQPGSKEALRAAADYFETLLHDSLLAIDPAPGSGNSWTARFTHPGTGVYPTQIPGLVVPADTIIIFAGGRPLEPGVAGKGGPEGWSGGGDEDWINLLYTRGNSGAIATPPTDFAPWGGTVAFDTGSGRTWNFSLTTPIPNTTPFLPIALHEIGHVLGLGLAPSWSAKIVGGNFTGANAVAAFGGNVPLTPNGQHWRDDGNCSSAHLYGYIPGAPNNVLSKAYGSFGTEHGHAQIALMDPKMCSNGPYLKVMTDLDLAALADIGWELSPPVQWASANYDPTSGPVSFTWPTSSNFTYRVQVSTTLGSGAWQTLASIPGDGGMASHTVASPPAGRGFFRLTTQDDAPPAAMAVKSEPEKTVTDQTFRTMSVDPVTAHGCKCGGHH